MLASLRQGTIAKAMAREAGAASVQKTLLQPKGITNSQFTDQ